ncbi:MAG TPA: hypothetical protein VM425_18270 [Myxococcota bacterium]|nr:hypothetical protein [Myxococcota bacterium]
MSMRIGAIFWLLFLMAAGPGCTLEGNYKLRLVFPTDEARQATDRVEIWALDPGGGNCQELMDGNVSPAEMSAYANLVVRMSMTEEAGDLRGIPEGTILFFAEGRMADDAVILRGCERKKVSGSENFVVTIALEIVCWPDPAGELPANGVDDDCDGTTDEEECGQNADCDDGNVCTADFCIANLCQRTNMDGINCNDDNPCTTVDACTSGTCQGVDRDCSDFDSQCLVGACNPVTVECEPVPGQDGTSCEDGLSCTVNDACHDGSCSGKLLYCDDSDPCTRDRCDEATGECEHTLEPKPDAEGPLGDPTCSDLLDNDCDGLTDDLDPNCQVCTDAADCEDNNPCTSDDCLAGECSNAPLGDGTDCNDGYFCSVEDHCQDGKCISASRDCSAFADSCHQGICVEAEDRCTAIPLADDTPCEDGLHCTVGDRCLSEQCTPLGPRACDDSDFCTVDSCNEDLDRCEFVLDPRPGEEGPPGDNSCVNGQDDDCDGQTDLEDGNCYECLIDADCADNNDCTVDSCINELCVNQAAPAGTSCDDGNACTMNDSCQGDYCSGVPLDGDADGYVAAACGGSDCDDGTSSAHPGLFEGPDGDASCSDSLDNDCDGKTDAADTYCWQRVCNQNGWCWENPLPQGNGLMGIWGFSPNDVWMVGWYGTILHWDGVALTKRDTGTPKTLYDVWGATADDVWAVGQEGIIYHYSGTNWLPGNSPTTYWLYGMWGFAANDIWAAEAAGKVLHYNGQSWTESGTGTGSRLLGIWGPDPTHLWAVGWDGVIRRRSSGSWSGQSSPATDYLTAVWGTALDNIWAVGINGEILGFQGGSWVPVDGGVSTGIFDVWGTAANNVWAVGEEDTILHFNGNNWSQPNPPAGRGIFWMSAGDLQALWGTSANDVWAVGHGGTVLRYDGAEWTDLTAGHRGSLNGVWALSENQAWAVGDGCTILRRDAATRTWSRDPIAGCSTNLRDISGSAQDNIWVVGEDGVILKWNGSSWNAVASNTTKILNGVWTLSGQDAWAVGDLGEIVRYQAGQWSEVPSGVSTDLNAVWAYSSSMAVAVGDGGVIRHWNGSDWTNKTSGTSENLYSVWGSAPDNVWVAGRAPSDQNNMVLHWNGSSWSSQDAGVLGSLVGLWGSSTNDVWAIGSGTLIHNNGGGWSEVELGSGSRMADIWGTTDGNIWIAGGSGNILRHQ